MSENIRRLDSAQSIVLHIEALERLGYRPELEQNEDGSSCGLVPELPVILGSGDTLELAEQSMREGIDLWIEDMTLRGQPIPAPTPLSEPPVFRTVNDLS